MFQRILNKLIKSTAVYKKTEAELKIWKTAFFPPGHYYSPFPDREFIAKNTTGTLGLDVEEVGGVDLNENYQLALLDQLSELYGKVDFPDEPSEGHHYYYQNQFFSYSDAIFLSCLMMHYRPQRVIEVGSGYSSAVMVDINNKFLGGQTQLTFVEPFPEERLSRLLAGENDFRLIKDFVQNIDLAVFKELEAGDFLFIDSSHVCKTLSDVNHFFFNVFPILKCGVIIHIHDIFYPFEYPREWILGDRAWNETYLLRAFLQYNKSFQIELFSSFLEAKHNHWFRENMPNCLKNHEYATSQSGEKQLLPTTGQSIYIKKCI